MSAAVEGRWRSEASDLQSHEERLTASYADAALEFGPAKVLSLAATQLGTPFADSLYEHLTESGWTQVSGEWHHGDALPSHLRAVDEPVAGPTPPAWAQIGKAA